MQKFCLRAALVAATLAVAFAQAPDSKPAPLAFEVATIHPAIPIQQQALSGKMHVGVSNDGARVDIGAMSLSDLIGIAYKVKPGQISGPDWLNVDRFDIMAKIPDGVAKDKMPEMLQTLLADRFKLSFHKEQKETAIYALTVGKNGPKLQEADPDPETEAPKDTDAAPKKDEKGVMMIQNGGQRMEVKQTNNGATISGGGNGRMKMTMEDGHMKMEIAKMTMDQFAEALSRFVDRPVINTTGITGDYKISLDLSMEDLMATARRMGTFNGPAPGAPQSSSAPAAAASDPSGGSVFQSVQTLGLKLDPKKLPIETVIIDHVEKTPTEN